jgi:hypothetical protein
MVLHVSGPGGVGQASRRPFAERASANVSSVAGATEPISVPLGTVVGTAALDGTAIARGAGTAFSGAVTGGHMGGGAQMRQGKIAR